MVNVGEASSRLLLIRGRLEPSRRETSPAERQYKRGHGTHGRCQRRAHGPDSRSAAAGALEQTRRQWSSTPGFGPRSKLASMDPSLALGQHSSEVTVAAMKASLLHAALCFIPPQSTSYLLPRGSLPQLQELHPKTIEHYPCPVRHRRLIRHLGDEEGLATTVGIRIGVACAAKNQAWRSGWSLLRPCTDEFRDASAEANELHAFNSRTSVALHSSFEYSHIQRTVNQEL